MDDITLPLRRLPHAEGLDLPHYATDHSAGMDLRAAVPADEPLVLQPGARELVPTGLQIALPSGFEGQVRPRSGLAVRHGVTVLNSPGTIDADYRGEVFVLLYNSSNEPFTVARGLRIAQLVVAPYVTASCRLVDELEGTIRGTGGLGHTGTT